MIARKKTPERDRAQNPHSESPASPLSAELAEQGREGAERRVADAVSLLVARGKASLESKQVGDAKECFEAALQFDGGDREARLGLNRVYRKLIPRWHFEMLNDKERNSAFERALAKAVTNGSIVLDIGSGSGLLAMMSARAGARQTISCEMITPIAELARETVVRNNYGDRVTILDKKSTEMRVGIDMQSKADLLVTETVDCGLLGEGVIPSIAHARANLLTDDAQIIPRSASVIGMVVESEALRSLNQAETAAGFDVSPINRYATAGYFPVRLGAFDYVALTDPFEAFSFDFARGVITPKTERIDVLVKRSGSCHAIVFWFEMRLDEEISLSNHPGSATHWEQALQTFETVFRVRTGEVLPVIAEHDCTSLRFEVARGSEPGGHRPAGADAA